jgi:hypothetical protein
MKLLYLEKTKFIALILKVFSFNFSGKVYSMSLAGEKLVVGTASRKVRILRFTKWLMHLI